jgi:DNA-binding NtrC family response regulator
MLDANPDVLLVEDNVDAGKILIRLLHFYGYTVKWARSLADAAVMLNYKPLAIVLDMNLPDGHGEDLIDPLLERSPATRVVIWTAVDDPERMARIAAKLPAAVIRKPLNVLNTLFDVLPRPRQLSRDI